MKKKKSGNANLEKNRLLFFEIGLILALSLILSAFEWSNKPAVNSTSFSGMYTLEKFDMIESTFRKPEQVKVERPVVAQIINPVDDDHLILGDPAFFNPEFNQDKDYTQWNIPDPEPDDFIETIIFVNLQEKPLFNGGDPMVEFRKYIQKNLTFPEEAIENGVDGRVMVEFIIDEHGKMTNVKILLGVHPSLDEEAARVIRSSPDWTPGKQRGKPVRVIYDFPVVFKLEH